MGSGASTVSTKPELKPDSTEANFVLVKEVNPPPRYVELKLKHPQGETIEEIDLPNVGIEAKSIDIVPTLSKVASKKIIEFQTRQFDQDDPSKSSALPINISSSQVAIPTNTDPIETVVPDAQKILDQGIFGGL